MIMVVLLPQYLEVVDVQRIKEFIWYKMVFLELAA